MLYEKNVDELPVVVTSHHVTDTVRVVAVLWCVIATSRCMCSRKFVLYVSVPSQFHPAGEHQTLTDMHALVN